MNNRSRKIFLAVAGLTLTLALAFAGARAQSGAAPAGGMAQTAPPVKKAPEQYKNIQVLKDLPADQLVPAMNFITVSLGVECEACHVEGAPDKDDKQMKLTARKMMQMQMDINKASFNGNRQITCYSCHRGAEQPVPVPMIMDSETRRERHALRLRHPAPLHPPRIKSSINTSRPWAARMPCRRLRLAWKREIF